jgi:RNA polymerase sigma-70 factor, ECF subfamily
MFTERALVTEMAGLKKFALKLTRNESDAEDLTQSTILRAIEKSYLFEPGSNLFSWLSKIMYNQFVSIYRRKVKFETQYDPENFIENSYVDALQETRMEFLEVEAAMDQLSPEHKAILVMVCIKGMQYAEVSEMLQIPIGTVRSRLSRARESLQAQLSTVKPHFHYRPHTSSQMAA